MTVLKAIFSVAGTAIGFGVGGGLIGAAIGAITPSYYIQLFNIKHGENVNPSELGFGLGVTQGLIWGLVIGLVIVIIIVWKETRLSNKEITKETTIKDVSE